MVAQKTAITLTKTQYSALRNIIAPRTKETDQFKKRIQFFQQEIYSALCNIFALPITFNPSNLKKLTCEIETSCLTETTGATVTDPSTHVPALTIDIVILIRVQWDYLQQQRQIMQHCGIKPFSQSLIKLILHGHPAEKSTSVHDS